MTGVITPRRSIGGSRRNERTELRPDALAVGTGRGVSVGVVTASVGEDRGWVDYLAVAGAPTTR